MKEAESSKLKAESEKIKVYYPGPDNKTYHPKLGKLTRGLCFELGDDIARPYIQGGLLREAQEETPPEAKSDEPKE